MDRDSRCALNAIVGMFLLLMAGMLSLIVWVGVPAADTVAEIWATVISGAIAIGLYVGAVMCLSEAMRLRRHRHVRRRALSRFLER